MLAAQKNKLKDERDIWHAKTRHSLKVIWQKKGEYRRHKKEKYIFLHSIPYTYSDFPNIENSRAISKTIKGSSFLLFDFRSRYRRKWTFFLLFTIHTIYTEEPLKIQMEFPNFSRRQAWKIKYSICKQPLFFIFFFWRKIRKLDFFLSLSLPLLFWFPELFKCQNMRWNENGNWKNIHIARY